MSDLPDGAWPVMLTPFSADLSVDWDVLDRYTDWLIAHDAAGLFPVALSGEMYEMPEAERLEVARRVVDRAAGRVPVLASIAEAGTDAEIAAAAGAARRDRRRRRRAHRRPPAARRRRRKHAPCHGDRGPGVEPRHPVRHLRVPAAVPPHPVPRRGPVARRHRQVRLLQGDQPRRRPHGRSASRLRAAHR